MSAKFDGGRAFPIPSVYSQHGDYEQGVGGMSLRDWFAGQAMPLAHEQYRNGVGDRELTEMFGGRNALTKTEIIAALAYRQADAMIEARTV